MAERIKNAIRLVVFMPDNYKIKEIIAVDEVGTHYRCDFDFGAPVLGDELLEPTKSNSDRDG